MTPMANLHWCQRHHTPAANLPPVSTTPAANFYTSFAHVVDTCDKFATGVNYLDSKFATVSKMPVANCHQYQRHRWQNDTADHLK
jgi:hypothetical protein